MFVIFAISVSVVGDWDFSRGAEGSIGIADAFRLSKLNRAKIESTYACCERAIVRDLRSRSIRMPRSHLHGPRSVMLYFPFMVFLNSSNSCWLLPAVRQSHCKTQGVGKVH